MPSKIAKAGKLLTMPSPPPPLLFYPHELLNALGLEGGQHTKKKILSLGEGAWDPATGGAIVIRTTIERDDELRLRKLHTTYVALEPNGTCTQNKLVEFDTRLYGKKLKLQNMTVMGRPVSNPDHIARVISVLQNTHTDKRNMQFPDIGKIMGDAGIDGLLGEKLHLPGVSKQGGFDFKPVTGTRGPSSSFLLPKEFMPELLGFGRNDFDPQSEFGSWREKQGFDRQNGGAFRFKAFVENDRADHHLKADIVPANPRQGHPIPDLVNLAWRESGPNAVIDSFVLLGDESRDLPTNQRQKRLGIVNAANRDLRARKYPALPGHVADFNQQDLIDRRVIAERLDRHPQMVINVYGGHNAREYLPGFGATIGGNSKGVIAYSRDDSGRVARKGFRVDAGIGFSKQGGIQAGEHGSWDRVLPDATVDLPDIKDDLYTHNHADHMLAPIDEARAGLMTDRTQHVETYSARVFQQFLKKAKISPELWPDFDELKGEGWIHLNDGRQRVLSAYYSTNAIPHSTQVTAFVIAPPPYLSDTEGRPLDGKVVPNPHYWSYATLGDMSFGRYNLPGYRGEKPPDTGFKRDFFKNFKAGMHAEYPAIPRSMQAKIDRINVVECDPTSVHREGWAPDVVTVEKNWVRMANDWFLDLGIIIPNLSTAKRQHEMFFRVGNLTGRNITGEGAYLEDRMTDMNVMGVNTSVLSRDPHGGNINHYINDHARKKKIKPVKFMRRYTKAWKEWIGEHPERTLILATGSQGTEIEQDSVGTQIAEGWSRFQIDPKYYFAAYGVPLRNFITVYAQSAIPGNEDKQLDQIRKTAYENDQMVAVQVHDGTRFYNLKEPHIARIKADLDRTGDKYTVEGDGGLFIHGFALYPPGHGWKEDWRQGFLPWFKENNVDMISAQHYPKLESVRIMHELADEIGLRHPPEAIPNHVQWTLDHGRDLKILGQRTPGFILARDNRRSGKYYGGTTEYLHALFPASEGGLSDSGFFVPENAAYFRKFAARDYEQALHEATQPFLRSRRDFDIGMSETPPDLGPSLVRPTRGMKSPRPLRPYPHLAKVA